MVMSSNLIFVFSLSAVLLFVVLIVCEKISVKDVEKSSPFECGFTSRSSSRLGFSLSFFLVALIFCIFDLELIVLFPMLFFLFLSSSVSMVWTVYLFIMVLGLGLALEWSLGSLEWLK